MPGIEFLRAELQINMLSHLDSLQKKLPLECMQRYNILKLLIGSCNNVIRTHCEVSRLSGPRSSFVKVDPFSQEVNHSISFTLSLSVHCLGIFCVSFSLYYPVVCRI